MQSMLAWQTARLDISSHPTTESFGKSVGNPAVNRLAQSTAQVMNRYLNRPPNIRIREGHRVKVYVTSDRELPLYEPSSPAGGSVLAEVRQRVLS